MIETLRSTKIREFFLAILAAAIVIYFNAGFAHVDILWHDDSWFYFLKDFLVRPDQFSERFQDGSLLMQYKDYILTKGMATVGVPAVRIGIIFALAIASGLFFVVCVRIFGIDTPVAFVAATLPNLLPSLIGIPVGINTSYQIWSLLPFLAFLLTCFRYLESPRNSWIAFLLAAAFFGMTIISTPVGIFFAPVAFVFMLSQHRWKKAGWLLGWMILISIWKLLTQMTHSHKETVPFTVESFANRTVEFLANQMPFGTNSMIDAVLVACLILAGIASTFTLKPGKISDQPPSKEAITFFLAWTFFHIIVFLTITPNPRMYDYGYIANFGSITLASLGTFTAVRIVLHKFQRMCGGGHDRILLWGISVILILMAGVTRQEVPHTVYEKIEKDAISLREWLQSRNLPEKAQVIILSNDLHFPHEGAIEPNSGYLEYLSGRKDISGLIGKERFPTNVFRRKSNNWNDPMNGVSLIKPLFVYRRTKTDFQQMDWLFQTLPPENGCNENISWTLFWLDRNSGKSMTFTNGCGIETYRKTWQEITQTMLVGNTPAFAPAFP